MVLLSSTKWILLIYVTLLYCGQNHADKCSKTSLGNEVNVDGNITLRMLVDGHSGENCENSMAVGRTQTASAAWIVNRLNYLNYLEPLRLGVHIFDTCGNHQQRVNLFLEMFLNESKEQFSKCDKVNFNNFLHLPILTTPSIGHDVTHLTNFFNTMPISPINDRFDPVLLMDLTIKFISSMNFNKEIVLLTNLPEIEEQFSNLAKDQWFCIRNYYKLNKIHKAEIHEDDLIIIFGNNKEIAEGLLIAPKETFQSTWVFVPLDGFPEIEGIPTNNSFIVVPSYADHYQTFREYLKLTPSPIFLNVAQPILNIVNKLQLLINTICEPHKSNTTLLLSCLDYHQQLETTLKPASISTQFEVLEILQIQQLYDKFQFEVYEVFEDDADGVVVMGKIGAYHLFNRTYFYDRSKVEEERDHVFCKKSHIECLTYCRNFNRFREQLIPTQASGIEAEDFTILFRWRGEAWVAALISISSIGFFSCFAVLVFITVRICKGDILEGNPTGSVLLLFTLMLMYLSIIPFAVIIDIENSEEEILVGQPNYEYILQNTDENITILPTSFNDSFIFQNFTELDLNDTELETEIPFSTTINDDTPSPQPYENKTMFFYINPKQFEQKRIHYRDNNVTDSLFLLNDPPTRKFITFGDPTNNIQNGICQYSVFSITFLYTIAFSLILSRFVMVASVGHEGGFMSHVNGYIQTTLCFFMTLTQLGINLQLWFHYNTCALIFNNNFLLLLMSYNVFLLCCLILITPFIIRTQRNYREGAMFTVAVYLIGLVWGIWLSLYYFVSVEWKHVLLASSVVATATLLLISVFIPRTYKMVTGIVRDHLSNALPALGHTQSHSVLDVNFRASSQAIYDCMNPVAINSVLISNSSNHPTFPLRGGYPGLVGQTNPNFYAEAPSTDCVTEERNNYANENTYERYDTPPSPTKITRF